MSERLRTRERGSILNREDRRPLIRAILEARLTETEYRRVGFIYGLDGGRPMSYRDVASVEDVYVNAVQKAVGRGIERVENEPHLWLLWLLKSTDDEGYDPSAGLRVYDSERVERGEEYYNRDEDNVWRPREYQRDEDDPHGWGAVELRPGDDSHSSDQGMDPGVRAYDDNVDQLTEMRRQRKISRFSFDRGLMLALAEEKVGRGGHGWKAFVETVEHTLILRDLQPLVQNECDRRLSLALRTYASRAGTPL